jgi:septum formation protein
MARPIILASGSEIRQMLLRNAGVEFDVVPPRVDESAMRESMIAEGAPARDIADALAEMKAVKQGQKYPEALVIGCDQVLSFEGQLLSKPQNPESALDQLKRMRGKRHELLSAAVICEEGRPVWRHVGAVRLMMRDVSDHYLEGYVARNWDSIRHAVGAYKLEEEGVRLFSQIHGDYFHVLGLPLLELLSYLSLRGELET